MNLSSEEIIAILAIIIFMFRTCSFLTFSVYLTFKDEISLIIFYLFQIFLIKIINHFNYFLN